MLSINTLCWAVLRAHDIYIDDDLVLTPANDDEVGEIVDDLKRRTIADGIKLSTIRYCKLH
jgi:hypothetical protein